MGLFSSKKRTEPYGLFKADAEQLGRLEARGVDVTLPRDSEFVVCFTTRDRADAASKSLKESRVRHDVVEPSHDVPEWTIMMVGRRVPLVPDFLREQVDTCLALADAHKGEYEGWIALLTDEEKAAD